MKTLYVSDLDGTLLRMDQTLSPYTKNGLNSLLEKGIIFAFATARSAFTAKKATEGISDTHYAVVYNGAFIVDMKTGERLYSSVFSEEEGKELVSRVLAFGAYPRVFSLIDGEERFFYTQKHLLSDGAKAYFAVRKNDPRGRLVEEDGLSEGEIFNISCTDKKENLLPLYRELSREYQCHFYPDNYSGDHYLEILPKGATKAQGILKLKELLGCDRIVVFGDGVNDISMFRAADEGYAVSNAHPELLAVATGVIGSCEEDAVVRFLEEKLKGEKI